MNIYIGNLPYTTTEQELVELFSTYGEVAKASLVMDRQTGRPRGFGFVEMMNHDEGQKAIDTLGGELYQGRHLTINEARNRQESGDGPPSHGTQGYSRSPSSGGNSGGGGGSSSGGANSSFGRIGGGYTNTLLNGDDSGEDDEDE